MHQKEPNLQLQPGNLEPQPVQLGQAEDPWTVIQNLNNLYKVDKILLKHAYQTYPEQQIRENSKEYKNIQKFYRYVLDNIFAIEKDYLGEELVPAEAHSGTSYHANRNNTSKFIRDERQHYDRVLATHASKMSEDELGLKGEAIYPFVHQCFSSPFTQILIDGHDYFDAQFRQFQFEQVVKSYCCNFKQVSQSTYSLTNVWLEENEILEFLTYWLKHYQTQQLHVLYCRTEEKLKMDADKLRAKAAKRHNSLAGWQHSQSTFSLKPQFAPLSQQIVQPNGNEGEFQLENKLKGEQKKSYNSPTFHHVLQKIRRNQSAAEQLPQERKQKPRLSKKEQLMSRCEQFFTFGCKRRYAVSKNTTFDQIGTQARTMNLQKFINFCNYYEIHQHFSRELLTQIFKQNALNRLTIDQARFRKIIEAMIQTSPEAVELFLQKQPLRPKLRSSAKLSDYKFMLRPINGKSIQNLEQNLQLKKQYKQKNKEERINAALMRRLKEKSKPKQKVVASSRILPDSTSIFELENMRDESFDPSRFYGNDHDELLDMYESKLGQETSQPSALSILSRRLKKGSKVLQKINTTAIRIYE